MHLIEKQERGRLVAHRVVQGQAEWDGNNSDDSRGCSSQHSPRSCLAIITKNPNSAAVLLCLSIRNRENEKKAAFKMLKAMQ